MAQVYLGLGTNVGDREKNIAEALDRLSEHVKVERTSSLYETEPVGYEDQGWFLNAACAGETELGPRELFDFVKAIERAMGREKRIRWGPRVIDIDILFYNDLVMETPELTIPHPRLHQRRFVLAPMAEIAPDLIHPTLDVSIRELLKRTEDTEEVHLFERGGTSCTKQP